jgi:hypothetical protein
VVKMAYVSTDKKTYARGETVVITCRLDGLSSGDLAVIDPQERNSYIKVIYMDTTLNWAIPANEPLGTHIVKLSTSRGSVQKGIDITSGEVPSPTGFEDTGKATPSTLEVDLGTYEVMFKLAGYKDKIILNVVVTEGATKTVSATLEPEVLPPVTKTVTFMSVPTGASVNVESI